MPRQRKIKTEDDLKDFQQYRYLVLQRVKDKIHMDVDIDALHQEILMTEFGIFPK